jgi:Kef-type K+ transport system membrane component KefB
MTSSSKKVLPVFALTWALCGLGIGLVLHYGRQLPTPSHQIQVADTGLSANTQSHSAVTVSSSGSPWSALLENLNSPLGRMLAQLMVIILATRTTGSLFRRIGLPSVVGEITAGILLGPSLFGWLWPGGYAFLFTSESLDILKLLSQIGVTVFMFVVGMELEVGPLRDRVRPAFLASQTGILVPFLMGMTASLFLYGGYAGAGTSFTSFALFLGISLSITAFPVLVRILEERGMIKTELGNTAITCAAVGDASAWAILAFVVAFVRAEGLKATLYNFALLALFVSFMLVAVRQWLPKWLCREAVAKSGPSLGLVAAVILFMTGSALATEILGIHALFGAFLAGAIMPRDEGLRHDLVVRMENFTSVLLMPLFFAFSGLRTHIGMLNDIRSWFICLVIVLLATVGKLGSSMFAVRLLGMGWNDAFAFGALMNTRGLMELIALNIGYDLGILPASIFTILVLMALITTFLTGPLLNLAARLRLAPRLTQAHGTALSQAIGPEPP